MSHCLGNQGLVPGRGGQDVVLRLLEGVRGALLAWGVCVGSSCLALGMLLCSQRCPRKDLSRVGACFTTVCSL